ncbi:uncharacterized protein METZ01_LOCUS253978 [marine metagenome]|uniref:Uncharacterized protein n=1 Tax=marine metagenome TaxID=408172 RepID=A0A382IMY0_9ZZZZ
MVIFVFYLTHYFLTNYSNLANMQEFYLEVV